MEMHARPLVLLLLLAAAVAPAAAQGQAAATTLLVDLKGDQAVQAGELVVDPPAFDEVDIVTVWAAQPTASAVVLDLETTAPLGTGNATFAFTVVPGPTSLPNSTATNRTHTLLYRNGSLAGLVGATASAQGTHLLVTVPLSAIGAVGGDVLSNLTVATSAFDPGAAALVAQDDSSAADAAPDAGSGLTSVAYTFARPPVAGNLALSVEGGSLQGGGAAATSFLGNATRIENATSSAAFSLRVVNTGLDTDTVTMSATPAQGIRVSLSPATLTLQPGEEGDSVLLVEFDDPRNGTVAIEVQATSARGAVATTTVLLEVAIPPGPPAPREPVPAALGFLTPVVEAAGLDTLLGRFAELAFLLFTLLFVTVVVFLLLFVVKTPWVRIRVTPRRVVVAPGGVAEFHVEMEGRRRSPALARATLRTLGTWTAGLQFGRAAARMGEPMDIPLESGKEAAPQEAILRVQVPFDAPAKDRQELEFDVVPVDAEGGSHPKHGARAKVTVEAAEPAAGRYASARDIRLADVAHDPPDPRPGATVRTTATIHNDGPVMARLRVVLQKEGRSVTEERIDVPPHDARNVAMPWTAGAGRNLVKVQIFLA